MMKIPHYLLFSETAAAEGRPDPKIHAETDIRTEQGNVGQWRFVLETADGSTRFEACDREDAIRPDRLELLAVVRGLEAIDQPSRVTLVTPSRYVTHGLRYGIEQWRENQWKWEKHGRMAPVRNGDLWRRVARALQYHEVQCQCQTHSPKGFRRTHTISEGDVEPPQGVESPQPQTEDAIQRSKRRPTVWKRIRQWLRK